MTADVFDQDKARRGLQGPGWRWQRALELAESRDSEVEDRVDDDVQNAARFVRILNSATDPLSKARRHYPLIAQAKALWDTDHSRQQFTIIALADFTRDAMSARLDVQPEVIEIAERLFFDIRDSRQATAWIYGHVIFPETRTGDFDLAVKYRHAFWGGAKIAEWILETGKVNPGDSGEQLGEQQQLLQMKSLAALEMPLTNSQEAVQFLKFSLEFQHGMKRLELEKEKFRTRAEQELRKYELAERRRCDAERRFEQTLQVTQQKKDWRQQVKNDRQRLASIQASLHRQRQYSEQQKRSERANRSPLAGLLWMQSENARTITRVTTVPRDEKQYVAA